MNFLSFLKIFHNIQVIVQIGNPPIQPRVLAYLNPSDKLSNIRKVLTNDDIIDDTLSFSKKIQKDDDILIKNEEEFCLNDILDKSHVLYLKPNWKFFNNKYKLDHGCTMSSDGIKKAKNRAFTMKDCQLTYIGAKGYKKGKFGYESREDWMKKKNLFVNVDANNVMRFVKLGLSAECSQNENINKEINLTYQYIEIGKISLNLSKENLELTDDFKNDVIKAIESKDVRNFVKITEEYGQFIPTEIILGGRVYFDDVRNSIINSVDYSDGISVNTSVGPLNNQMEYNHSDSEVMSKSNNANLMGLIGGNHPNDEKFDEKAWIESLIDQNLDCIEFKNPISIFQLLPNDLHKKAFESVGKKILYTNTEDCDYSLNERGSYRTFELNNLPQNILDIILNKEADCDIFAAVVNTDEYSKNVFFNCQVLKKPEGKPSIIIHGIQKKFQPKLFKLKIGIMVVGYDTDFNFIHSDSCTSVQLEKYDYNDYSSQNQFDSISTQFGDDLITKNIPLFGIPVISNLTPSIIIGHNFRHSQLDNQLKVDIFSYNLKKNCYDNLPQFTFCILIIYKNSKSEAYLPFKFTPFKKPFVEVSHPDSLHPDSLHPKYVSLYLSSDNHRPIFLSQKVRRIKIKYINCNCKRANPQETCICNVKTKYMSENAHYCIVFDPNIK